MEERRNAVICKGKATQSEAAEAHRFERHRLATAQQKEDILLKGETSMQLLKEDDDTKEDTTHE